MPGLDHARTQRLDAQLILADTVEAHCNTVLVASALR
jgi:hypothetical protein